MKIRNAAIVIVLLFVLALPTAQTFAQGTSEPSGPSMNQVFLWVMLISQVLTLIGLIVAGWALYQVAGVKTAIQTSRNDITGLNKLEAYLTEVLKPSGMDMLNMGNNAMYNLITFAFASKIDPEALEAIKAAHDYINVATDRKPNLPPDYGETNPTSTVSAVKAPANVGPSVTSEVR